MKKDRPSPKIIHERTMFKILLERTGALFSFTTKRRAYFFFFSTQSLGARVSPTTDPFPGIVEICDYDITTIVRQWTRLANVKLKDKPRPTSEPTVHGESNSVTTATIPSDSNAESTKS